MNAFRRSIAAAACAVAAVAAPAAAVAADPPVKVSARPVSSALTTKAKTATVVVTNAGRRRLSRLTLTVGAAKGVRVVVAGARRGRTTRALPTLRAGRSARVAVRASRTSRGPRAAQLTVTVRRGRKTLATARISFGARRPGATEPTPPANPNTLEGRYFWGSRYTLNGIQQNTLWFTGPSLVWVDATEGAWPTCTAVSEQCKPYSYDAAANALTIDGRPATLTGRGLSYDDDSYREFGFPAAGTRWDTYVTYSNSSGICPLYCSYYTENLAFRPDGTFIRDAVSSGSGPIIDWGVVPPDSKGTYEVRADRTLRLAYADGRERIETVANYLNDDGSLQPVGDGLLLGGDGYFDIRD